MATDKQRFDRILVVGTTPDYIAYIYQKYPNRVLFLTDTSQRMGAKEEAPDQASEIVTTLHDFNEVYRILTAHLKQHQLKLTGITCYDCEWLELASILARQLELPYSSTDSVRLSRNKMFTKKRWSEKGVPCPRIAEIDSNRQAIDFVESLGCPIVLKPMTGAGSELTFRCNSAQEAEEAFHEIRKGLMQRGQSPLYRSSSDTLSTESGATVLAEEFVQGDEYSADFIVEGNDVRVIRTASKLRDDTLSFGTTVAYTVHASFPDALTEKVLAESFGDAARALGISHAVCMVDFIVNDDSLVFLELTPRIGGDCLPPLIRQSCGMDTIDLAMDFAEGRNPDIPGQDAWKSLVGLRLFARASGRLRAIHTESIANDPRVKEIYLKYNAGHSILLPPEDYNSWMLGHIIFEPSKDVDLRTQCEELRRRVEMEIE